ncbi:hypothetical protein ABIA39_002411 [Nocardia sp. GAS34]|uniref:DUF4407 domain-containing protein n=1 Tax=unclassified Nocardia TaxID=2637762 RepID=UPI003D2492AC
MTAHEPSDSTYPAAGADREDQSAVGGGAGAFAASGGGTSASGAGGSATTGEGTSTSGARVSAATRASRIWIGRHELGRALRTRAEHLLTWLGGASSDAAERHERSSYAITGAVVLLFAVIGGVVVTLASAAGHWPALLVILAALITALLLGAVGRALATAPLPDTHDGSRARWDRGTIGRVAIAAVAGIVVAELASTVLLGGTVGRQLDETSRRAADSAPAVVNARAALDRAQSDRQALGGTITAAQTDIDQALIIARCEYNPTPACPQDKITGVPGRGPETQTDNSMLDDARARLAAAQARVQPLDDAVTRDQQALDQARTTAFRTGDRGLGARWVALNDYTLSHPGALALRLATIVIAVALALLPLLLRRWRGETTLDRKLFAHAAADRAERDATAAIAVRQAQARAEAEILRTDQELAAARLAMHADTVIDREQQRRRIIAAIGGVEIGVTAPQRRAVAEFEALAELPAADPADHTQEGTVSVPSNLPATRTSNALAPATPSTLEPAKKAGGLELPIIGTVPFTDTAARWIRPLVPSFVTDAIDTAIDTATSPLRTVRQVFEESEEITFTLRRNRKVTVDSTELDVPGNPAHGNTVIDAAPYAVQHSALSRRTGEHNSLSASDRLNALTPRPGDTELEYRGARQLPPGPGR